MRRSLSCGQHGGRGAQCRRRGSIGNARLARAASRCSCSGAASYARTGNLCCDHPLPRQRMVDTVRATTEP